MKNHNLFILLLSLFILGKAQAQYTLTAGDVTFVDGEITAYLNTEQKNIIIPSDFDGTAVTSIGQTAFYDHSLGSVTLPNSLTTIGEYAFSKNILTSVTIPNSVSFIGQHAFNDNQLPSLSLPNGNENGYEYTWYNSMDSPLSTPNTGFYREFTRRSSIITYDITYYLDGGTATNPSTYNVETPTITLADATKEGYTFNGWYSEEAFTNQVEMITLGSYGDLELFASFTAVDYTITYNLDGGATTNPATYTIESDFLLADATKEGYTFDGWYVEDNFINQVEVIHLGTIGDVALFPKFTAIDYTISFNLNGGESTNPSTYNVETATITLADATKEEYTFNGWYSDEEFANEVETITLGTTGNLELFASFTAETITGLFDLNKSVFSVYPNPTTGFIHTEVPLIQLRILNTNGMLIKEFNNTDTQFDVSELEVGAYVLQATDESGLIHSATIIKQ